MRGALSPGMVGAKRFTELICWQLSFDLRKQILDITSRPGVRSDVTLRDQLRDSARSAPRNIAEGFGRRTNIEFARYLDIARGSLMETQNHIQDAAECGYVTSAECEALLKLARRAGAATAGLQNHLRRSRRK